MVFKEQRMLQEQNSSSYSMPRWKELIEDEENTLWGVASVEGTPCNLLGTVHLFPNTERTGK